MIKRYLEDTKIYQTVGNIYYFSNVIIEFNPKVNTFYIPGDFINMINTLYSMLRRENSSHYDSFIYFYERSELKKGLSVVRGNIIRSINFIIIYDGKKFINMENEIIPVDFSDIHSKYWNYGYKRMIRCANPTVHGYHQSVICKKCKKNLIRVSSISLDFALCKKLFEQLESIDGVLLDKDAHGECK